MKYLLSFLLMNLSISMFSQTCLLSNETLIFSFQTKSGKIAMLAKDKDSKYIIYRFGTKDKIEFEFPTKSAKSWKKFKYSHYSRGGGKQNLAEDLTSVSFVNKGFVYRIYDSYYSESDEFEIGVLVHNLKTNEVKYITGILKSKKGKLHDFDGSNLLDIENEM